MIRHLSRFTDSVFHKTVLLALPAMLLVACEQKAPEPQPPRLVNAMRIADTSGLAERSFPGRARAGQEVNRSFRVSGPLIAFPVSVGDEVKAGDVLARIDPKDFENELANLQGQLGREQAKAKRAQADLTRLQNIFEEDPGATSQGAIDRAVQARDSARASVRSLQASVQNARDQLSYTELKAPFDGTVVETYVENFETVVAKQPILRVLDPTSIEFVVSVPENLITLAPYVTGSTVTFDALPGIEIPAKIKEISKEASQATRTYPVTLVMEQPEGAEILPGMAGQASITSRPPEDSALVGIQVPATAVFTDEDKSKNFVWIIDESTSTLSRREVEIAQLARYGVLIKAGLEPGEWIVVKGVHSVKEGQKVRILDIARQDRTS